MQYCRNKKYKSIIKKKNKKHDKIVFSAKSDLLYFWWICVNKNVVKEYDDVKEEIKKIKELIN